MRPSNVMMKGQKRLSNWILSFLLVGIGLLASVAIYGDTKGPGSSIEESVRRLLRSIHSHNYEAVLSLVSERGLVDADQTIPKSQIASDLRNPESYLRKTLYKPVSTAEIELCRSKLGGRILVSPWAFYERYGENFRVKYSKIEESADLYTVKIIAQSSNTEPTNCEFQLWFTTFQQYDGRYYLCHYFFE